MQSGSLGLRFKVQGCFHRLLRCHSLSFGFGFRVIGGSCVVIKSPNMG